MKCVPDHAAALAIVPREKHYPCAEMVPMQWGVATDLVHHEFAILAEIWRSGGVFLVDEAVDPGTNIVVTLPHAVVNATVLACRPEQFSFALEVDVAEREEWFGGRYEPAVLVLGEVMNARTRMEPQPLRARNPVASMLHAAFKRDSETQLLQQAQ